MTKPTFTEHCVYTIRHSTVLRQIALTGGAGVFEAGQAWTRVKELHDEALRIGAHVPVVFAPAEGTRHLFAWATIEAISLRAESPRTSYRFSNLRLLARRPLKTTLRKASDGEPLAEGFIRPYAVCVTPSFVHNFAASDVNGGATENALEPLDVDMFEGIEGDRSLRSHIAIERDRSLVDRKRTETLRELGRLACEACGFDFLRAYGERGRGFCEVHHKKPLGMQQGAQITTLDDLAVLCSNCHRMAHRTPILSVPELQELLRANTPNRQDPDS